MTVLGQAAAIGISPSRLLRADPVERDLLLRAVREAQALQEARDQRLARLIINEYAQAMRRSR